jgi:hypothetical protein
MCGASPAAPAADPLRSEAIDVPALERSDTGLNDIAAYLTTPVRAGLFLSRGALRRAAAAADVPTGFTPSRHAALADALRDAGRFDRLPAFVAALRAEIATAHAFYRDQPPALGGGPWIARLDAADALLRRLAETTDGR